MDFICDCFNSSFKYRYCNFTKPKAKKYQNRFLPNHFVDISDYLHVKKQALDVYELEMRAVPHSRNKEHLSLLAAHHGHCMGIAAAEAFMVIRYLR